VIPPISENVKVIAVGI